MENEFNPKKLKKLIDVCRKAGVDSFKGFGVEFTLLQSSSHVPSTTRQSKSVKQVIDSGSDNVITESDLTEEELLFWSAGQDPDAPAAGEQ